MEKVSVRQNLTKRGLLGTQDDSGRPWLEGDGRSVKVDGPKHLLGRFKSIKANDPKVPNRLD